MWRTHQLDQADLWLDRRGVRWRVEETPPETAAKLVDDLRSSSVDLIIGYTRWMNEALQLARDEGADIDPAWSPDSIPYFDQIVWMRLEGVSVHLQIVLATQWLDTKPLIQALEARGRAS